MRKALLDSNIISYFLRGNQKVSGYLASYAQFHSQLTFSFITYYEIKSGLLYRDTKNILKSFEELVSESEVLLLDLETASIAGNLYKDLRTKGLLVPPMDIFIAATAIQHDLILITANIKHFQRMQDFLFENWAE